MANEIKKSNAVDFDEFTNKKIPFNTPLVTGKEIDSIKEVISLNKYCGDGSFTKRCNSFIEDETGAKKVLLTTSCTHALEIAAILLDIQSGDEVIMPSFTFVSSANAFVLRGAKIVFVDIRPDTMNINEELIEDAITPRTKVIVPVHYAGVACEMNKIMKLARKHHLYVVEDAAQCIGTSYHGKALGTIGHFGTYSFHETKNIHCGEGGALLINDKDFIERAEIIREKGTNRSKFLRGQIDKYSWVDVGSSYLPSELNAAFLLTQLESHEEVKSKRLKIWNYYYENLLPLQNQGKIELPNAAQNHDHNGHIFYLKLKDMKERQELIKYLKTHNIQSVFHYVPLHSAKAGLQLGIFHKEDHFTTKESERLLRLPMYYSLDLKEVYFICQKLLSYFE